MGSRAVPAPAPDRLRAAGRGAQPGDAARDLRRRADRPARRRARRRRRPPRTTDARLADRPARLARDRSARSPRCCCSPLACGPLGVWILLYRDAYAAESLSHGMLPGPGARRARRRAARARRGGGRARRRGRDRARRRATRGWARRSAWPWSSPRCSASARSSRSRPRRRRGWPELLFGDLLGVDAHRPRGRRRARGRGRRSRSPAAYRPLALAGFDRGSARALGAPPAALGARAARRCWRVTTVAAVQGLGNLLLVALILAPGAAALRLCAAAPRGARARRRARRARRDRRACCSPTTWRSPRAPPSRCARSPSPRSPCRSVAARPIDFASAAGDHRRVAGTYEIIAEELQADPGGADRQ